MNYEDREMQSRIRALIDGQPVPAVPLRSRESRGLWGLVLGVGVALALIALLIGTQLRTHEPATPAAPTPLTPTPLTPTPAPSVAEPSRSFASIASYDLLEDGRTLVLAIGIGRLDSIGYVAADEDATSVRVRVLLLHHPGTATADRLRVDVRTGLGDVLGSRSVLDQDGRPVPRRAR
jgi:hypothetical protein